MKVINSTKDLKTILNSGKPVLLDFYADWCGPCRALMPTIEQLAEKHKDEFEIAKVNVDNNQDIAQHFGVRSIPALFFVENGKVKEHLSGIQSEAVLDSKIQKYLAQA